MVNDDEQALLEGLRSNDPASFELLLQRYGARLISTASRILGNTADAEDVVQDAIIGAWKAIHEFEGSSRVYTWLHRIVVNGSLARLRTQKRRGELDAAAEDSVAVAGIPAAWSESGISFEKRLAMRRAIETALDGIPAELRTVLLLRDVEELSSKEVAAQLGIPDALVRQRLHRARTVMAELLRPELCQGPELTCGGQLDLLLDYIDRALPADLQAPVHQHLETCEPCGRLLGIYRATIGIPKAILELTEVETPGGDFVARTLRMAGHSRRY